MAFSLAIRPMPSELDQEQNNRIQAFVATYNVIDSELRRRLKRGSKDGFVEVLRDARSVVGTSDFELLNTAAQLRNFLIHDPKRPYDYVAVPTSAIVDRPRTQDDLQILTRSFSLAETIRQSRRARSYRNSEFLIKTLLR